MEKQYPNNYAWAGRTALMYNVLLDGLFDVNGTLLVNGLQDVGMQWKLSSDNTWNTVSIKKNSSISSLNDIYSTETEINSTTRCIRYPNDNQGYKYLYPCRVMISGIGEDENNKTYQVRSYKTVNDATSTFNNQEVILLDGINDILCEGVNVQDGFTETQGAELKALLDISTEILDMWMTGVTWHFTAKLMNLPYAADKRMYFSGIPPRTVIVHEMAHNYMSQYYTTTSNIIKFMEFATGVGGASWRWLSGHNYPVISSMQYDYIDDCLVAAACQVTRS